MLLNKLLGVHLLKVYCRNATNVTPKQLDTIQQSFISKIREYGQKSKNAELGLVDASATDLKAMNEMLAKIDDIYGAVGQDMTKFPTFKFEEPKLIQPSSSLNIEFSGTEADESQKTDSKDQDTRKVLII